MSGPAIATAADTMYETLGFAGWRSTRVDQLSGGTKAKLNLAIALLADPDVLLLDEPYAGFDWDTYLRFWRLAAERRAARSEEHTSELQSLMRLSYAVFCLKKKNTKPT